VRISPKGLNRMTHAALKLQKIKPQKLKSLGFNEARLQKQIDEDATLLGLGDLQVIKKERKQLSGGRIDFLMADFENDIRYEVEVMRTLPGSAPGSRDGLPGSAQAAAAALACWFTFQFQGSRLATLLAG
jgi:hypothetical protein